MQRIIDFMQGAVLICFIWPLKRSSGQFCLHPKPTPLVSNFRCIGKRVITGIASSYRGFPQMWSEYIPSFLTSGWRSLFMCLCLTLKFRKTHPLHPLFSSILSILRFMQIASFFVCGPFFCPRLPYVMYLSDFFVYNYHYAILHNIVLVYVLALLLSCYLNCLHIIFITSFYTYQIKWQQCKSVLRIFTNGLHYAKRAGVDFVFVLICLLLWSCGEPA